MNVLSAFFETSYRALLLWMMLTIHPSNSVAPGLGEGYWHTRGNQILDSGNRPVRIAGINWYGFETANAAPGGLDIQDYRSILDTIKANGYNTVRIPFSTQMVEFPAVPTTIRFTSRNGAINSDLKGLTSLQVLDHIIAYAGSQGLKIILDNHRSEPGDGPEANGLWFTPIYSEAAWINDWQMLARRYADNPTVIGMDLRNEPHNANSSGACWSCGGPNDWHLAAERAGNAVLNVNPRLLIFVEGVDAFENDFYWWGGNLEGVRTAPVKLSFPHQLVYSPHDYGPAESGQPWFTPDMNASILNDIWTRHWAYISKENIAPVWLGEFGVASVNPSSPTPVDAMEAIWFRSMIAFLAQNDRISWAYWAVNGEDRNGLLNTAYDNPLDAKQQALTGIQSPLGIKITSIKLAPTPVSPGNGPEKTVVVVVPHNAPAKPLTSSIPSSPATGTTQCRVAYTNQNDWSKGFTGSIVIHNDSDQPIQGWKLTWSYDGAQHIQQLWNGVSMQQGTAVTVSNAAWNATIPPKGDVGGIGFNADYTGANHDPVRFYLNGTLCS